MVRSLPPLSAGSSTALCTKNGRVTQMGLATKYMIAAQSVHRQWHVPPARRELTW